MLRLIKSWIYDLVTSSGILISFVSTYIHFFGAKFLENPESKNEKLFDDGGDSMSVLRYKGKLYPTFLESNYANMRNLQIRNDDVMLCGYPKTGCHWVHEILNMLVTGNARLTKYGKELGGMIEFLPEILLDSLPSPRVLNCHLPYDDLPEQIKVRKTKIVVTVRSPKDTVVSFYNHVKALAHEYHYNGSFENFFKLFINGQLEYGSYFDAILDWENVAKSQKDNDILIVEYEKLKKKPLDLVKEMARFLDIEVTEEFARQIVETTNLSNMKAKQTNQKLLRKGQVGDWRNWLTEAQSKQIDQVWKDRMSDCGYQPDLS